MATPGKVFSQIDSKKKDFVTTGFLSNAWLTISVKSFVLTVCCLTGIVSTSGLRPGYRDLEHLSRKKRQM